MEEFIQQLLRDQGIPEDLDADIRAELIEDLTTRANDLINQRLIDALSDQAVEEFNKLLDDESVEPARLQEFIAANVPERQRITTAALLEFRQVYLGDKA
jgi:Protein of unknown function (DUF5663)